MIVEFGINYDVWLNSLKKFNKDDRSSFSYWFNHWKAFNLCALQLHQWKFKYLFHDIEKPWLKLVWSYQKVQSWHRKHNKHHFEYPDKSKIDWEGMVLDNECSRYTKLQAQLSAREWFDYVMESEKYGADAKELFVKHYLPVLEKFGI